MNASLSRSLAPAKRGFLIFVLTFGELFATQVALLSVMAIPLGVGLFTTPEAIRWHRRTVNRARELSGGIAEPYLREPEYEPGFFGRIEECRFLLSEPATRRDLAWGFIDPIIGGVLALQPLLLILYGLDGILMPFIWLAFHPLGFHDWYTFVPVSSLPTALAAVPVGVGILTVGLRYGETILGWHQRWTLRWLEPSPEAEMARRVQKLTESRADAVDSSAAELRRIERDLHDGAQARLVAMGMTLGAIEHLLEKDPEKAKLLLSETRQASAKALSELRDLVRGIHPPVLSDRGLVDAVKALALDSPLNAEVIADVPGRPDLPVESAAYFAVSEVLTNAAKHSGARRVWIDLHHEDGVLRVTITDDGRGGASMDAGTGLRGIERRIGTFDGILALSSPVGGPTIVTMELPCVLSSPRTSSSSETA